MLAGFCLSCWIVLYLYKYLHVKKFAAKKCSWKWEDASFFLNYKQNKSFCLDILKSWEFEYATPLRIESTYYLAWLSCMVHLLSLLVVVSSASVAFVCSSVSLQWTQWLVYYFGIGHTMFPGKTKKKNVWTYNIHKHRAWTGYTIYIHISTGYRSKNVCTVACRLNWNRLSEQFGNFKTSCEM